MARGDRGTELIEAAAGGDDRAVAELFRAYRPMLLRFFRWRGVRDWAEDLVMDVWLGVVGGGLARFSGDERQFRSWLLTLAERRLIDHYRQSSRRVPGDTSLAGHGGDRGDPVDRPVVSGPARDPAQVVGERIDTEELLELLIEVLTAAQSRAVTLYVVGGLDIATVALMMDRSRGAVSVLLHRAFKRLGEHFSARIETRAI